MKPQMVPTGTALPLCQLNVRITPASRHPRGISSGLKCAM
jgi:hypothetical protein